MEKILDTKEAADFLKVSSGTLENWRIRNEGPEYLKPKGKVYYRLSDLETWLTQKGEK